MQTESPARAAAVLATVADPLRDLIESVMASVEGWNCYSARVEEIETKARSGFVPFTDGGYDGRACAGVYSSEGGGYLPKCLQEWSDRDYADKCADYVAATYPGETFTAEQAQARFSRDIHGEGLNWSDPETWHSEAYRLHKAAEEWEQGWQQEDPSFFYDARAIFYGAENWRGETGEDEVYFFAAVNTDFDYGRDSISWAGGNQHRGEWSRTVKIADLTPDTLAEVQAAMIAALAEA